MTPPMNAGDDHRQRHRIDADARIWRIVSRHARRRLAEARGRCRAGSTPRAPISRKKPMHDARDAPEEADRRRAARREASSVVPDAHDRACGRIELASRADARRAGTTSHDAPKSDPGIHAARSGGMSPLPPMALVSWMSMRKMTVVARLSRCRRRCRRAACSWQAARRRAR